MKYDTFDALLFDLLDEYDRGLSSGLSEDGAIARCAALIAVHRDDLASLNVSFGVARALLALRGDFVDGTDKKSPGNK